MSVAVAREYLEWWHRRRVTAMGYDKRPNRFAEHSALVADDEAVASCIQLDLSLGHVKDEDMHKLRALQRLTYLNLAGNIDITADGLSQLAPHLPLLQYLNLESIVVGDEALECLRGHPSLISLTLDYTQVTDDGVHDLVSHLPGLEHLSLAGCDLVTEGSLASIAKLAHLNGFDVSGCINMGGDGYRGLPRGLTFLDVSRTVVKASTLGDIMTAVGASLQFLVMAAHHHCVELLAVHGSSGRFSEPDHSGPQRRDPATGYPAVVRFS